jgi:hypothetical protein
MFLYAVGVGCVLIDTSVSDLINICKHSRSNLVGGAKLWC